MFGSQGARRSHELAQTRQPRVSDIDSTLHRAHRGTLAQPRGQHPSVLVDPAPLRSEMQEPDGHGVGHRR